MTERSLFFGSATRRLVLWPAAVPVLAILLSAPFVDTSSLYSEFALAVGQFSATSALLLLVFFVVMNVIGVEGLSRSRAAWSLKIVTLWLFAITSIAANF